VRGFFILQLIAALSVSLRPSGSASRAKFPP
jgi:hypothetical protein